MPQLPPFSLDHDFTAQEAWHDKIGYVLRPVILQPTRGPKWDAFGKVFHRLASASPSNQDALGRWRRHHGWLFNASQRGSGLRRNIRQGKLSWGNRVLLAPLLSGHARMEPRMPTDEYCIAFYLNLNPSRYLHHHPRESRQGGGRWLHHRSLSMREMPPRIGGEFSLDGKDNWMPATLLYHKTWARRDSAMMRYFRLIEESLESQLDRASETRFTRCLPIQSGRHSLQNLETYWEFASKDPMRIVDSLVKPLRAFSRGKFTVNTYQQSKRGTLPRETQSKNLASISVPLRAGEQLVVYAKTNLRVRFEIRQDLAKNPRCLGGTRTATSLDSLERKLVLAREHCADRMNEVFEFLRKQKTYPPDSKTTVAFLADIAAALHKSDQLSTVLSLLLTNRGIERVPGLSREIAALNTAKIIKINPPKQSGAYVVSPPYTRALNQLARKGLGSVFGSRRQ